MNDDDNDDCAFCEVCDTEFDPDNPRTAVCPHCGEMLCSDKCLAEHLKDYCRRVDRGEHAVNWAKKLLTAGGCPRCGGRLEDLGDGQVSCDTCSYPGLEDGFDEEGNPIEVDEPTEATCDNCGRNYLPADGSPCPVCGKELCGDRDCLKTHVADEHPDASCCDWCGNAIDGPRYISARRPELKFCSRRCRDDYVSKLLNPFNS